MSTVLDTYAARRDYVRDTARFSRADFDKMTNGTRDGILANLGGIVNHPDPARARRDSMGCLVTGGHAPHVGAARELIRRFTAVTEPAPDTSPAARAARLVDQPSMYDAACAVRGASKAELQEIARINGWGPWSTSWTVDQWHRFLTHCAVNGADVPLPPRPRRRRRW